MDNTTSQLIKFAKSDMKVARQQGDMMIAQTKRGTVMVDYDSDAKRYTVATCGIDSETLIAGAKAGPTAELIASLYDVVEEG